MTEQQTFTVTMPSLPKGGGAIQSIGKGWGGVGSSGAASLEIALPISPGRDYTPALQLSYNSTSGNGLFGLGWNLSLGCVARFANKGAPAYTDDDLILGPDGALWLAERNDNGTLKYLQVRQYNGLDLGHEYQVIVHHPRTEGAFDLIERWRRDESDPGFWLVHGADGSLHLYGFNPSSCSVDPDAPMRVAQWLLEESMNAHGEHILYEYKGEDLAGFDPDNGRDFRAQCYLWRVRYGNARPHAWLLLWDPDAHQRMAWHFDLLFDYGERSIAQQDQPAYDSDGEWLLRSDPHSSFAYGFELGNLRLCQQVLMFHHFPDELGPAPVLTQRLLLQYQVTELGYSHLAAAHSQAYTATGEQSALPPMTFTYADFVVGAKDHRYQPFEAMPGLNDGQRYQLVDLYGEGLPGVLYRSDKAWYYREPLRAETLKSGDEVAYSDWQVLPQTPVADRRKAARQFLTDLTGDGRLDWVIAQPGLSGFFTLNPDRSWSGFAPFAAFPTEFFHPLGQLADLVGDGLSDLALIGPRSVRLYANRRAQGFAPGQNISHDEDDALPLLSDSATELVAFSDMLGTGQQHLVRIRHNEVRCWPNLGRGRFGKGFRLARLPFAYQDFDASRVLLADLDGSGASDLIYLQTDHLQVYMNLAGNGLQASPRRIQWPEGVRYDRLCQVSVADLQGLGCASLVLSVPHMTPRHWRLDFIERKPYLLCSSDNHMGAVARVTFRSSAQEWLDEKQALRAAGEPVASYLPFAMHLVSQQTQLDEITGNQLTQQFQYRQGYYDTISREFRGFGLVLQRDAETSQRDQDGYTAPALRKTWFHTGRYPQYPDTGYDTSDHDAQPLARHLLSHYDEASRTEIILDDVEPSLLQDMARALAGSPLRSELFGQDAGPASALPYAVEQHRYLVRRLQPRSAVQPFARMLVLALESISYQYERQPDDPRCQHNINLGWDHYGVNTHAVSVSYARRKTENALPPFEDEHQQTWWRASHDEAQQSYYLNESRAQAIHLDSRQSWRLGLPYRQRGNAVVIAAAQLHPARIGYEHFIRADGPLGASAERVLTGQSVQRYQQAGDGEASFVALPGPQETAELDEAALSAYDRVMSRDELHSKLLEAGYRRMPAHLPEQSDIELWSVQRGFATYADAGQFYKMTAFRETSSHGLTRLEHDPYHCLLTQVTLPDGCTTQARYDYRSLQPVQIIDANQNTQEALYDGFGRLLASSFYGSERGEPTGFDPLDAYERNTDSPAQAIANPQQALQNAASACFYDAFSWMQAVDVRQPVHSAVLLADRYPDDPERQIRISIGCVDGFGRDLQSKQKVEPGQAYGVDEQGHLIVEDGQPQMVEAADRWRVSERVEYNNKGLPIRVYRPYFAERWRYINDASFRLFGYSDQQYYDPLGRGTRTVTAKGYLRRETHLTWYTISEDENDTYEEVMAARQPHGE